MLHLLDANDPQSPFPDPDRAELEPNGLLALGGDLQPQRLLNAYRRGVFPWFGPDQPILWWSPDPRMVLAPQSFRVSRSLRRTIRNRGWTVSMDQAFGQVIAACAAPRDDQEGTWIVPEMIEAYQSLHELGRAHSVEVWAGDILVGGLYGIAIGQVFFGESMFSSASDASKVALLALCRRLQGAGYGLIDCQVQTPHLESLGARNIPRAVFVSHIGSACGRTGIADDDWPTPRAPVVQLIDEKQGPS